MAAASADRQATIQCSKLFLTAIDSFEAAMKALAAIKDEELDDLESWLAICNRNPDSRITYDVNEVLKTKLMNTESYARLVKNFKDMYQHDFDFIAALKSRYYFGKAQRWQLLLLDYANYCAQMRARRKRKRSSVDSVDSGDSTSAASRTSAFLIYEGNKHMRHDIVSTAATVAAPIPAVVKTAVPLEFPADESSNP